MTIFCRIPLASLLKVIVSLIFVAHLLGPSFSFGNEHASRDQVLRLAAASNLRFSMDEIATAFERVRGVRLEISYGASGSLLAQILAGAPFDLFFSADEMMPKRLIKEGFGLSDHYFIYGTGRIVLWVSLGSPIDLENLGMNALLHHTINKISIANPRYAPYGLAAVSSLQHLNLFGRLEKKLLIGENVSHAATFVRSGGAEIGILSYTLALSGPLKKTGRYWLIPTDYHPTLSQGGLILSRSNHQSAAKSLVHFIKSGEGLSILKKYGFSEKEEVP